MYKKRPMLQEGCDGYPLGSNQNPSSEGERSKSGKGQIPYDCSVKSSKEIEREMRQWILIVSVFVGVVISAVIYCVLTQPDFSSAIAFLVLWATALFAALVLYLTVVPLMGLGPCNYQEAMDLCKEHPELDQFRREVIAEGRSLTQLEFGNMQSWPLRKAVILKRRANAEARDRFYVNNRLEG